MSNQYIGKQISLLFRYGRIFMAKELEPFNIGKGQFLFLLALYHRDGLTQEELVDNLKIDKGTTARALFKLEKNGYIDRKPNQKDLRSNQVFLTEKGKAFRPRLYALLDKWSLILNEGLTPEEIEKAFCVLEKMAQNATNYIDEKPTLGNERR